MKTIKSITHKFFGLYIIGAFTTLGLLNGSVFAQSAGGSQFEQGFWVNGWATDGIKWIWGTWGDAKDRIIDVIKNFINYALGFLALIAFGMLIYGGYKMVASGGDDGAYKEGIGILKNAAIGIAFIAVSWFLVTFIFFVMGTIIPQ